MAIIFKLFYPGFFVLIAVDFNACHFLMGFFWFLVLCSNLDCNCWASAIFYMQHCCLIASTLWSLICDNINTCLVQETYKFQHPTCYTLWEAVPLISHHCVSHSYQYIDRLHLRVTVRKFKSNSIAITGKD